MFELEQCARNMSALQFERIKGDYEQIIRDVILSQTHDLYYTYISLKSGGKKFEFHKEDHQKT